MGITSFLSFQDNAYHFHFTEKLLLLSIYTLKDRCSTQRVYFTIQNKFYIVCCIVFLWKDNRKKYYIGKKRPEKKEILYGNHYIFLIKAFIISFYIIVNDNLMYLLQMYSGKSFFRGNKNLYGNRKKLIKESIVGSGF